MYINDIDFVISGSYGVFFCMFFVVISAGTDR